MWACQVWYIALTLNRQNSVVSEPTRQSKCSCTEGGLYRCCSAAARQWSAGWEGSHLVNTSPTGMSNYSPLGCDCRQVLIHSWQHLSHGWHARPGHKRKWSYTGCTAQSSMRFRLANDSCQNGWLIGAILHTLSSIISHPTHHHPSNLPLHSVRMSSSSFFISTTDILQSNTR